MKRIAYALALMIAGAGLHAVAQRRSRRPGGYVIEHDADIAKTEPGHAQRRRPDGRLLVLQEACRT